MSRFDSVELKIYSAVPRMKGILTGPQVRPGFFLEPVYGADDFFGQPKPTNAPISFSKLLCIEDKDVDETYSAGEEIFFKALRSGDEVWAYIQSGNTLSRGDRLSLCCVDANHAGTLTSIEGTTGVPQVAISLETIDTVPGIERARVMIV